MKKILYLGLNPKNFKGDQSKLIHLPIIKTVPRDKNLCIHDLKDVDTFTHLIFTSQTTVDIFFDLMNEIPISKSLLQNKIYLAVGQATKKKLESYLIENIWIAKNETQEGVIELIKEIPKENSYIFWPHSALSRKILSLFLKKENYHYRESIFYDTVPHFDHEPINFNEIKEIIFTSPSTVDAFLNLYPTIPNKILFTAIGPITKKAIEDKILQKI